MGLSSPERPEELRKHLVKEIPSLLDEFYGQLQNMSVAEKFPGNNVVPRLKDAQLEHWKTFFADEVSPDAFAKSRHIGEIHQRIGLTPAWYVSAYGWLLLKTIPLMTQHHRMSRGNLNAALSTLVLRLFTDMATSLTSYEEASVEQAVSSLKEANTENLGKLAQAVAEINNIILQLAFLQRNSNDVATNGQTISSAAAELVASVEEIARNSESASGEAGEANQSVSSGRSAIEQMSSTIGNIASAVEETSRNVDELAEASDQIGQILSVIEGIAAQTNLLALNATIESARAGEAGKGFAVVASEVKNLANQTARSTEDIAHRIAALREGMSTIQKTMQASTSAVNEGEEAISHAAGQMGQIADQVSSVSNRMMEISGILGQQKGASSEIASSIGNVADIAGESDRLVQTISKNMHRSTSQFSQNARDMFDADSDIALCYMAKIDHVLFKQRVVDTCMGADNWKSSEVPDHHTCRLGKWYDGIKDPTVRGMPAFTSLVEPHKIVHASAKTALDAAVRNDPDTMSRALRELDDASVHVLKGLDELSMAIKESHKSQSKVA